MESSLKTSMEDETRRKYTEIIATLPRDHGWKSKTNDQDQFHLYEGFSCYPVSLEGIMSTQEHFIAQPTDIVLSSPPKSGTTWLKALAFAIVTRTRFDDSTSPLLTTMPHECMPFMEMDLVRNPDKRDPDLPLLATHIPYTSLPKSIIGSGCKIVYIYKDPKDAFVSLWYFVMKLNPKEKEPLTLKEAFKLFCRGVSLYGPYWDHVLGYYKSSLEWAHKVFVMNYEDLMRDTTYYVKKLAKFMGYSFSLEEEKVGAIESIVKFCSFENLSNLDVNKVGKSCMFSSMAMENNIYFRKGKTEDWKNHLTIEMVEEMDRITEQKFGSCGLVYSSKS